MHRSIGIAVLVLTAASAGCTFGDEPRYVYVAQNATLWGDVGDASDVRATMDHPLVAQGAEREGVAVQLDDARVSSELELVGDLESLCPGTRLSLHREGERLVVTEAEGSPAEMRAEAESMQVMMASRAAGDGLLSDVEPESLRLRVGRAAGSDWVLVEFDSEHVHDGAVQTLSGTFEMARTEQSRARRNPEGWD